MTPRPIRPPDSRSDRAPRTSTVRRRVLRPGGSGPQERTDTLAAEEPLEIRLYPPDGSPACRVAVTMRTPGHDFELAAGFLFTERVLRQADAIRAISYCTDPSLDGEQQYNIVNVSLRAGAALDVARATRHFYATSSCGICGKASIDAIRVEGVASVADDELSVDEQSLGRLADRLRAAQPLFEKTGGLHAAGLFDLHGNLVAVREDVGRHNAVDKIVGRALLGGELPLRRHILLVSGRASFEITQKAAAAGIPVLAAVSAPSSLACDTAEAFGMTLVGFVRGSRFSVYTGAQRIRFGTRRPDAPAVEALSARPAHGDGGA